MKNPFEKFFGPAMTEVSEKKAKEAANAENSSEISGERMRKETSEGVSDLIADLTEKEYQEIGKAGNDRDEMER